MLPPNCISSMDVEVVVIPTHRSMVRIDRPDVVFSHRDAKDRAIVAENRACTCRRAACARRDFDRRRSRSGWRAAPRPQAFACQVLNAKNDAEEASIVARAGALGAVTISTNMAGRGTDIRLGGEDETDRERVAALGGLYVIGTNRHESRRVDLQLRGRAGRQGDPGESRFFVSLEDDLFVRYGIQGVIPTRSLADIRDAHRQPDRHARGRARAADRRGSELRDSPDARPVCRDCRAAARLIVERRADPAGRRCT